MHTRPPGRPPLVAGQRSISICFRVSTRDFDRMCATAHAERTTLAAVVRRELHQALDDDDDRARRAI